MLRKPLKRVLLDSGIHRVLGSGQVLRFPHVQFELNLLSTPIRGPVVVPHRHSGGPGNGRDPFAQRACFRSLRNGYVRCCAGKISHHKSKESGQRLVEALPHSPMGSEMWSSIPGPVDRARLQINILQITLLQKSYCHFLANPVPRKQYKYGFKAELM